MTCDCRCTTPDPLGLHGSAQTFYIQYCPLHQAAESLLKACRLAYGVLSGQLGDPDHSIQARLETAIRAATGGQP